jgi:hypothetical protein
MIQMKTAEAKVVLIRHCAMHVHNCSAHNTRDASCVHLLSALADCISHLETVQTTSCLLKWNKTGTKLEQKIAD